MQRAEFISRFAGIFEESPWVAERLWDAGITIACDSPTGLHTAMVGVVHTASAAERLALLSAHPRLGIKKQQLGAASMNEQRRANLDSLSDDEASSFVWMNDMYIKKFGFPFIMAVRGFDKDAILQQFATRLGSDDIAAECVRASAEVEKIALFRITELWDTLAD